MQGSTPPTCRTSDEPLLVAVAAFVHRARIDRQASVSGQLSGHELQVAEEWTVVLNGEPRTR